MYKMNPHHCYKYMLQHNIHGIRLFDEQTTTVQTYISHHNHHGFTQTRAHIHTQTCLETRSYRRTKYAMTNVQFIPFESSDAPFINGIFNNKYQSALHGKEPICRLYLCGVFFLYCWVCLYWWYLSVRVTSDQTFHDHIRQCFKTEFHVKSIKSDERTKQTKKSNKNGI